MLTYESVAKFVDGCISDSARSPEYVGAFRHQAFGAIRFVCENCWRTNPELETKIAEMWENVWKPMFEHIEFG